MSDERLHRDHHPVEVYAPDIEPNPIANARVFITSERIQVWRDVDGMPTLHWEEKVTEPVERDRGTLFGQIHVQTARGPFHVTKGRGCGCHSPLKALSPPVTW